MAAPDTAHLRPDKIAVWPVEGDRYGIDLSYAGTTGHTRADQAHQTTTPTPQRDLPPRTRRHVDRPPRPPRPRRNGPRRRAPRISGVGIKGLHMRPFVAFDQHVQLTAVGEVIFRASGGQTQRPDLQQASGL